MYCLHLRDDECIIIKNKALTAKEICSWLLAWLDGQSKGSFFNTYQNLTGTLTSSTIDLSRLPLTKACLVHSYIAITPGFQHNVKERKGRVFI